ncbi:MAG: fumarylacetoacetate hydrolase family protein [Actinomycetota bacterium]
MSAAPQVEGLARRLLEAERARVPIDPLTDERPDLTLREAYRIQEAALEERGSPRIGYKLGFTSEVMRRQMGISGPNYGRLTRSMPVDADAGPIPLSGLIHPRVEPEVALLVERELAGPGLTRAEVYPAVRLAFAALEVVDSRFRDYRFRLEDNTADNSSAARFVLGPPVHLASAPDLRLVSALLWKDGRVLDGGIGADAMGDPLSAVVWLANSLGEEGRSLEEGSIVLTGGLTRAHPVGAGGTFVAEFGGLGAVWVHFGEEG